MLYRGESSPSLEIETAFIVILWIALIPSAITFYTSYFILFPTFFQKKKFFHASAYGILTGIVSAIIGFEILRFIPGIECSSGSGEVRPGETIGLIAFMSVITIISGTIAFVMQGFINWFSESKLREALLKKNHQTELALIKSQLDPHFLFNTINNIDVLILKDSDKASHYLNKLSDIMRFMLYETKTNEILLSQELDYIVKYIELQKIRTANANYIELQIEGQAGSKKIAPMVFIPFLENAFKHTTNKKLDQAIRVSIIISKDTISFTCINKFDPGRSQQHSKNSGLGNELIKKRLCLLYPERHSLSIKTEGESFRVHLSIQHE